MPKQKKPKTASTTSVLYVVIVILFITSVVLAFAYIHKDEKATDMQTPSVSLGTMQYDFSTGKAVKRNDSSVNKLKAFLETDAQHEGCSNQDPAYERVVAYSKDETQVFVKYGCGATDAPIYAVQVDGNWKMLSPTNHFDAFDVPECDYLTSNSISKEIAPVCVNGFGTTAPTYSAR